MDVPVRSTDAEWDQLVDLVRLAVGTDPGERTAPGPGVGLSRPQRNDVRRHRAAALLGRRGDLFAERDRAWLRTLAVRNTRRAVAAAARAHEVTTELAAAGVRSLVLKGTPLAVITTGEPAGRWCGDVDLLVDPQRYDTAHAVLLRSGWDLASGPAADPVRTVFRWTAWIDNHASYRRSDPSEPAPDLELHWRLGRSMLLGLDFETLWGSHQVVDVGGVGLPALGPEHLHLHVLAHALRHNTERLQWAVDVALLERRLDPDASARLDRIARSYQPERTRVVARAVVQRLGLLDGDEHLAPLERRLVRASLETLRSGTTTWSHTAGTLAVTGSASGLARAGANAATRGLERVRHRLPDALARQVHRLPDTVTTARLPETEAPTMLGAVHDRPTVLHRVRQLGQRLGVDVRRWPSPRDPATAHVALLRSEGVELVLDVGAAGGAYATVLRDRGLRGRIVSCEPLPESFRRLRAAAESDPQWEVRNTAVGAATGVARFQVAGNADSSSLLPMLERHTEAAPHSATVGTIEVEVTTVDDLLDDVARPGDRVLLKLDVQGAESDVLDGTSLDRITAIHLEHSLVELYDGSVTFDDLHARLRSAGFELVDVSPGFRDPRTSRLLQFDATYLRGDPG